MSTRPRATNDPVPNIPIGIWKHPHFPLAIQVLHPNPIGSLQVLRSLLVNLIQVVVTKNAKFCQFPVFAEKVELNTRIKELETQLAITKAGL